MNEPARVNSILRHNRGSKALAAVDMFTKVPSVIYMRYTFSKIYKASMRCACGKDKFNLLHVSARDTH